MRTSLFAVSVVIVGCGLAQMGGGRVDPVLAALIPSDTIILAGIRMSELRGTPLYTKLLTQQRLTELDDFARRTNFDPRKDVSDMLVAWNGTDSLLLARGNFKIQMTPGRKTSIYKGVTIHGKEDGTYAILDPTTAVAGGEPAVRKAIDQKQSGQRGAAVLVDQARGLPGNGQIWLVSKGWGTLPDSLSAKGGNISNANRFLRSIESATLIADLRSGLVANATGQCKTEQDSKTLSDAARGMVGLGRLSVPENQPEMLRLFDGIKVEQKQKAILLNVNIPADLVDRMLKSTEPGPKQRQNGGKN